MNLFCLVLKKPHKELWSSFENVDEKYIFFYIFTLIKVYLHVMRLTLNSITAFSVYIYK